MKAKKAKRISEREIERRARQRADAYAAREARRRQERVVLSELLAPVEVRR